jgi:hypothetical protein
MYQEPIPAPFDSGHDNLNIDVFRRSSDVSGTAGRRHRREHKSQAGDDDKGNLGGFTVALGDKIDES